MPSANITLVQSAYGTTSATFSTAAGFRRLVIVSVATSNDSTTAVGDNAGNSTGTGAYVRVAPALYSGSTGNGYGLDFWMITNPIGVTTITPQPGAFGTIVHTSIYEFSGVEFASGTGAVFGTSTTGNASVTSTVTGSLFFAAGQGGGLSGTPPTGWTAGHQTNGGGSQNTYLDAYLIKGTPGAQSISGMSVGSGLYQEVGFTPATITGMHTRVSTFIGF